MSPSLTILDPECPRLSSGVFLLAQPAVGGSCRGKSKYKLDSLFGHIVHAAKPLSQSQVMVLVRVCVSVCVHVGAHLQRLVLRKLGPKIHFWIVIKIQRKDRKSVV